MTGKLLIFRAGDQLPANSPFHRWTGRQLLRDAACVVCNARFLADKFMKLGLAANKLRVIQNHPPQRMVSSHQSLPEVSPGAVVIVFVGQISEHKGAPVFAEAAKRILSSGRNVVFWLVGESTWGNRLAEELKRNVADAGFERQIRFLGYRKDVPEILRAAHIHVCPSVWDDPSPNAVLEAKSEGLPSVVFPIGGIPELIEHRVDGYICQDQTVEALVEGIEYFVTDGAARRTAGEAARRSLEEKFGEERFRQEWASVFIAPCEK
jgi:glycosyltransferase involved in cell wall biosynthesis